MPRINMKQARLYGAARMSYIAVSTQQLEVVREDGAGGDGTLTITATDRTELDEMPHFFGNGLRLTTQTIEVRVWRGVSRAEVE